VPATPHRDKLLAALRNPKCTPADKDLLTEGLKAYDEWMTTLGGLTSEGDARVRDLTSLLNRYKDHLEVDLIARRGSAFVKRQKGQLKLDNSIIEEFLVHLINPRVIKDLPDLQLDVGPCTAFMSLAFMPTSLSDLGRRPSVVVKEKDQDFVIGKTIHYRFCPDRGFEQTITTEGRLVLAVLAAECKINLDKTMFQEAAGTAARLKQGCPLSRYYVLVEYLDMQPEDSRLTAIDNVFLLRHARRLPFEKRDIVDEVKAQHQSCPIDPELVLRFVNEIRFFVGAAWYDPNSALARGSFV
jgi:hypothetical protein